MSHLQLSSETRPPWHGGQWCYTRPSYPEFAPASPVQPRALFALRCSKSQATIFQSAWTSPTALICRRILASSTHTSLVLAELQLTLMDERHKTSAPNNTFQQTFSQEKKARLSCPVFPCWSPACRAELRTWPGGILWAALSKIMSHSDRFITLTPPCCHHTISQKPCHISSMLWTGRSQEISWMQDKRREISFHPLLLV